jgi:hypothetical protein
VDGPWRQASWPGKAAAGRFKFGVAAIESARFCVFTLWWMILCKTINMK